jgi:hypothetical protein
VATTPLEGVAITGPDRRKRFVRLAVTASMGYRYCVQGAGTVTATVYRIPSAPVSEGERHATTYDRMTLRPYGQVLITLIFCPHALLWSSSSLNDCFFHCLNLAPCPPAFYCPGGSPSPIPCPPQHYSNGATGDCTLCPGTRTTPLVCQNSRNCCFQ